MSASPVFPLNRSAYELQKIIGRGATSDVYSAKCLTNGEQLAIKVIDLEICPIEIETLRSEVAFWSTCNHPNVVKYYGSFIEKSVLYILMEYMSGGSCYEVMRYGFKKGFTNEQYIASILGEVLKSLAYFHENRRMHRDVKAGNILMNDKGEVKIADFGIAANLLEQGQRKRARFTVIGTPCYMAPEVLTAGTGYTEKADIWSLGITAIELATGAAPYANLYPLEVIVRISNSPPPTLPEDGHFSSAFRDFVKMCLQQTPAKRASARELLDTKFIKQKIPQEELARGILSALPPLEERFTAVHTNSQDAAPKEEATDRVTEWDFAVLDEIKPAAKPEPEQPHGNVVKKGRFTISQAPVEKAPEVSDEKKIAMLEEEIISLQQRIESLTLENKGLKQKVGSLAAQVNTLISTDDKA